MGRMCSCILSAGDVLFKSVGQQQVWVRNCDTSYGARV